MGSISSQQTGALSHCFVLHLWKINQVVFLAADFVVLRLLVASECHFFFPSLPLNCLCCHVYTCNGKKNNM